MYLYVCLLLSWKKSDINEVLKSFEYDVFKYHWRFSKEGNVSEFLGVYITKGPGVVYNCTQEGFIKRVTETTGANKLNGFLTPTKLIEPLVYDTDDEPPK